MTEIDVPVRQSSQTCCRFSEGSPGRPIYLCHRLLPSGWRSDGSFLSLLHGSRILDSRRPQIHGDSTPWVSAFVDFPVPGLALDDGSYLSRVYPSQEDQRRDRKGVVVRVIEFKLEGIAHGKDRELYRLRTTLVDPDEALAKELTALYHERWEIACSTRSTTLDNKLNPRPAWYQGSSADPGTPPEDAQVELSRWLHPPSACLAPQVSVLPD